MDRRERDRWTGGRETDRWTGGREREGEEQEREGMGCWLCGHKETTGVKTAEDIGDSDK